MYKIAILGCENSHAKNFLNAVINNKLVDDIEFVGVYSDDMEASMRLHNLFGVYAAQSYDEFVGKVDGIMITARHGDDHYRFAKPYIESGIPMFIDKPITCSEEDAKAFLEDLKAHQVPVSGGSMCVFAEHVQQLKKLVAEREPSEVLGGFLRAPINMNNPHGNFFFYSQHMVQVLTEIFGSYPNTVRAVNNGDTYTCLVRYDNYDITLSFTDGNHVYYAGVSLKDVYVGDTYQLDGCSDKELLLYHDLLDTRSQKQSYEDFFAPVYILNALNRAIESGVEEKVNRYEA